MSTRRDEPGEDSVSRAERKTAECLDNVADDLTEVADRLRRAVEDGTVPPNVAARLIRHLESLTARMRETEPPGVND
ncbi:hypothetical protein [Amycolatopsis suaedae]|uniref:Uncharacterized protein n=1 Tax=Amycolatopsis suaedae TaxID=2510978 RepID=A0A4V2EMH8_9PSEU|nr:hypothetical protein [Amycolatopsis suaedae]RZQ65115.1 hypothetical protein EWH70_04250 [Amycolatopsis suaedae]